MTTAEWAEYRRRIALREERRREIEQAIGWCGAPTHPWWWDSDRDEKP